MLTEAAWGGGEGAKTAVSITGYSPSQPRPMGVVGGVVGGGWWVGGGWGGGGAALHNEHARVKKSFFPCKAKFLSMQRKTI